MSQPFLLPVPDAVSYKRVTAGQELFTSTDFDSPPGPGTYIVFIASSVVTATLTINQGINKSAQAHAVPIGTNETSWNWQAFGVFKLVTDGVKNPTATLGGTTGTCWYALLFYRQGRRL